MSIPMTRFARSQAHFIAKADGPHRTRPSLRFQLRPIDGRVSGKEFSKEKNFFIAEDVRHFAGSEVCVGHPDVFCLTTLVAAVKVRIAK
jgi:hypothetical protein